MPMAAAAPGGRRRCTAVGGTAYVYFVYGMHHQFNVVTGVADVPHAVLVRALEPVEGVALMRERRRAASDRELTSGPGKLCQALGIDRALDAADLLGPRVWIERGERPSTARGDRPRPARRRRLRGAMGGDAVALLDQGQSLRESPARAARVSGRSG